MKSSSAPGWKRSRLPLVAMLALAATMGLAGCENDGDGGSAPPPDGGSGGTGPTGPTGPSDVPISQGGPVRNIGTGSGLTAQQIADIGTLIATIDSAAVTGNKPVLEITVKTEKGGPVLGLAASTLRLGVAKLVPAANSVPSRWQSYINRLSTAGIASPALASAVQANVESGVAAGWTELGDGRYRYVSSVDLTAVTTPIAVTYEPGLTHRYSIAIDLSGAARETLAPDNPFRDFVPNGSPVTTEKLVSATEQCATCHVRFAEHGGPRRDVEFCVVCHNPGSVDPDAGESVDMAYMAHSIHQGEDRASPYVVYGYQNIKFDAGEFAYPQPVTFCETCHTQSAATPQGDDWKDFPNAAACGGCHVEGLNKSGPSSTTGRYTYTFTHPASSGLPSDFLTFDDGDCRGCHKPGGTAGDVLEVHKRHEDRKAIENGELFTYRITQVENAVAGQAPKVTFQILKDGQPVDVKGITTGRLRLDFAWTGQDVHNIADIAGDQYAAPRGEAIVVNLIDEMASVVDNGDGTFSYTLAQPLPAGFSDASLGTGLMVVLEGRRVMPDGSEAYPDSAYAFAGGPARTQLVAQEKCEACHKKVAIHGGSRAGDPMICTACHNSSVGGTWDTDVYGAIALGAFIHGVHAGNVPALGGSGEPRYPQSLGRCEGCHLPGTYNLARTNALPITVDAGTTLEDGPAALAWTDDLADSATAGTCKGCHASSEAISHMAQQGGSFGAPKSLTPSSAVEGCAFCHAPGRSVDTAAVHE